VPQTVKCVFSLRRKMSKDKSSRRTCRRGPATANALSPRRELVQVILHLKLSDDRSWRPPVVTASWQSSDIHGCASNIFLMHFINLIWMKRKPHPIPHLRVQHFASLHFRRAFFTLSFDPAFFIPAFSSPAFWSIIMRSRNFYPCIFVKHMVPFFLGPIFCGSATN